MINVTKTFLPPKQEYQALLSRAWDSGWITNRGELVLELEKELISYLGVSNMLAMTNGTLPLQIAIKALELNGDILTTPFSYVATTSSIVWENCNPIFVDINPKYLTIDETKIEASITSQTSAILATHVFGNPCNVEAIEKIAKKYNLKVIYDGAHCFGVKYKGKSIFEYGDVSTCSFHATKLFHTGEGGAIFCNDYVLNQKIFYHHNFGHKGKEEFFGIGVNAKMSELQAAMGLAVLPYINDIIKKRQKQVERYYHNLKNSSVESLVIRENTEWNYSYFPIIFQSESKLEKVKIDLELNNIYPRRYFYPVLTRLPYVSNVSCPNAERIASRILCLPLFYELGDKQIDKITEIIDK